MPLIQTAALFTAGLLTTTSLFASTTPQATDTEGSSPRVPCDAAWPKLPADLRADLTAARDLPSGQRLDALKTIRTDALDGDYGTRVQEVAERREYRVRAVRRLLPADLKADLRNAHDLTGDARIGAYRDVRDDALAGVYGDRVQQGAQAVRERRETCGRS